MLADRIEKAKKFVSDPMHLIWRNNSGKLVATANVKTNVAHPRVGSVFTLKEERGKSYAKMLVHYLSSLVLKSGKMPMLFTDYDYTPSNRCYEAVGYRLNCVMANFNPSPKYNINEIIQQRFERSQKEGR